MKLEKKVVFVSKKNDGFWLKVVSHLFLCVLP
jgi:hypothetical protein